MNKEELYGLTIADIDQDIYSQAIIKWDQLSKPIDGFGEFERIVAKIAAIQHNLSPSIARRVLFVMCADNGIVSSGISQSPSEVTRSVATNLGRETSSASTLARACHTTVVPVDIGIDCEDRIQGVRDLKIARGTRNFLTEEAMTLEETLQAIEAGIALAREYKAKGYEIIATGEMGIGNTTTSTALLSLLLNLDPEEVTGRGAGLDDAGLLRKKQVIREAMYRYSYLEALPIRERTLKTLAAVGGLDIASITGIILGAALYGIPVVIDGLITSAAAVAASRLNPGCTQYIIASHKGREGANSIALKALSLKPVIGGDMALGEGTGALMLLHLLDTMVFFYNKATTFSEVEIEAYERLTP